MTKSVTFEQMMMVVTSVHSENEVNRKLVSVKRTEKRLRVLNRTTDHVVYDLSGKDLSARNWRSMYRYRLDLLNDKPHLSAGLEDSQQGE